MTYTVKFCYVSPTLRDFAPLLDERGQEITLQVDASSKSATYYHPDIVAFCASQGNDCRIMEVR